MWSVMWIIGIDGGLANIGFATVQYDSPEDTGFVSKAKVFTTTKEAKSRRLAVSTDDNRRFQEIFIQVYGWLGKGVSSVGIEGFGYHPGAGSSLIKTAQAIGTIKGAIFAKGLIPIEVMPIEVKKSALGRKSGSKTEVQKAVLARHPELQEFLDDYARGKHEHIVDACAVSDATHDILCQHERYLVGRVA